MSFRWVRCGTPEYRKHTETNKTVACTHTHTHTDVSVFRTEKISGTFAGIIPKIVSFLHMPLCYQNVKHSFFRNLLRFVSDYIYQSL